MITNSMSHNRFERAIALIDAANANDPNTVTIDGHQQPQEAIHAQRRTDWIEKLTNGTASEELMIAARGQHMRRWEIPRDSYPRTKGGYLRWREALKTFHAEETAKIMLAVGYDTAIVERVKTLILKKGLKRDSEVQTLEDSLCLVFLETQFSDFSKKEADKIINIVRKTWRKMSDAGQQQALQLPLKDADRAIIEQALGEYK